MKHVLCKVYAAFSPVGAMRLDMLEKAAEGAMGNGEPWLFQEGEIIRISFEGVYFPVEEVLAALARLLPGDASGKLDYLDLEEWKLHRHVFTSRAFSASERSLNHVLDYSGH